MKKVVIIGTVDVKGSDYRFLKGWLEAFSVSTLVMNTGILRKPAIPTDVSAEEIARAGGSSLKELRKIGKSVQANEIMGKGAAAIIKKLHDEKMVGGVISLGGRTNTTISCTAMRALPIGIPKLMISTLASGDTRPFVADRDIIMMPPIVDASGLNRVSRQMYMNAAAAMAAMTKSTTDVEVIDKPCIATTIFAVTTPCVSFARKLLEKSGYEVLVFHAVGTGGQSMESLIREGFIKGVLDITTTELADELVGGIYSAGPNRLEAACEMGIPQIIIPGALDMVNFGPPNTIADKFKGRNLYEWHPTTTLMRTNIQENEQLGELIADRMNESNGHVTFAVPQKGFSALDAWNKPFYDPEADAALSRVVKSRLKKSADYVEIDHHINDRHFAEMAAKLLLEIIQ